MFPNGVRYCPNCGGDNTHECSHAKMPYRCRDCRTDFSVKTGTVHGRFTASPLLKWLYAIYLDVVSLKGVSSMKLHRDPGTTQKTARDMQQRIREAFAHEGECVFSGLAEVDEAYFGGVNANEHGSEKIKDANDTAGKTAIVGIKDRKTNISIPASRVGPPDWADLDG